MKRIQDNSTQKGDTKNIKYYRHISLLYHMYEVFTQILQKEWKRFWIKTNQENRLVSEKVSQLLIIFKQLIN